ncbi:uncharacterized protein LOC106177613 [Lingula anatina]|uniref:Uncharacterized protein LOC106177613 n=1 Tax=Lingula anatina TaxID=7574 RepID=A0A1S3K0U7_LINAN|nr:uncharacterized protein LOC106177613 [Lingula anatina]|eukprot:XP_013415906.1 uncharacterized protein LOC106177613 [Lingula anatina]
MKMKGSLFNIFHLKDIIFALTASTLHLLLLSSQVSPLSTGPEPCPQDKLVPNLWWYRPCHGSRPAYLYPCVPKEYMDLNTVRWLLSEHLVLLREEIAALQDAMKRERFQGYGNELHRIVESSHHVPENLRQCDDLSASQTSRSLRRRPETDIEEYDEHTELTDLRKTYDCLVRFSVYVHNFKRPVTRPQMRYISTKVKAVKKRLHRILCYMAEVIFESVPSGNFHWILLTYPPGEVKRSTFAHFPRGEPTMVRYYREWNVVRLLGVYVGGLIS